MANCTYTIDGKEIKGVEGLKAWLVNGGLESLYPDGSWVQAKEPESSTKPYEEKAKEYKEQEKGIDEFKEMSEKAMPFYQVFPDSKLDVFSELGQRIRDAVKNDADLPNRVHGLVSGRAIAKGATKLQIEKTKVIANKTGSKVAFVRFDDNGGVPLFAAYVELPNEVSGYAWENVIASAIAEGNQRNGVSGGVIEIAKPNKTKEPGSANKDVTSLSLEEANNLIKQSPNNLYSTSSVEDWGTNRGQGKRMGSKKAGGVMVVGAMSNAVTGKKTYTDILGKLKESEPENYEELNGFEQYRKSDYAKARAAGFDHDYAFSYMIRDDVGNWMESAKEYKQNGGVIVKEPASTSQEASDAGRVDESIAERIKRRAEEKRPSKPEEIEGKELPTPKEARDFVIEHIRANKINDTTEAEKSATIALKEKYGIKPLDVFGSGNMFRADDFQRAVFKGVYATIRDKGESLPVPVKESDVDREFFRRAYNGTSFSPEERGDSQVEDYIREMVSTYEKLDKLAKTDTQKALLNDLFSDYKAKYIQKLNDYMAAHSRNLSSMITGPARFPTARAEKANRATDNKLNDLIDYNKKAIQRMEKAIVNDGKIPQTPLEQAKQNLASREKSHEIMKAANVIVRDKKLSNEQKIEKLIEAGLSEKNANEILKPDYAGRIGFASYALQNNLAEINRLKQRVKELEVKEQAKVEQQQTGKEEVYTFEGGRVEINRADDRVRIFHDEKPSEEVRAKLKSRGFHWSRQNTAWQRQITDNAINAALEITGAKTEPKYSKRFASFDEALNDAERELRSLAKDTEQDGDVLLGNGKFVSFNDALRIVKEGIEEGGLKPVPFQIHDRLDISMRDVDRLLAAANSVKYSKGQSSGSTVEQIKSWLPRNVRKMLDAGKLRVVQSVDDLPANLRGVGEALFHTVFHGTPHDFDRFSLDKIGTGEGAQAFGYGLYFTDAKEIADFYRTSLSKQAEITLNGKKLINRLSNYSTSKHWIIDDELARDIPNEFVETDTLATGKESKKLKPKFAEYFDDIALLEPIGKFDFKQEKTGNPALQRFIDWLSTYDAQIKQGNLYQVELAPTQDEYLDWDKPLSEQSETVKSILGLSHSINAYNAYEAYRQSLIEKYGALGNASEEEKAEYKALLAAYKNTKVDDAISEYLDANLYYVRLSRKLGSDKAASDYLHSLGIRGIRYKAEGGKSDANNYVIFSDDDISITAKYSKLSGVQGLYDNKSDTVYLVADMLDKGNLQAVLSHELYHRGLATDKKLQDAHNRFMGDMQRRFDMAAKGIGSKADKEAYARVQAAETPAKDRLEEFAAYQISAWQQTPDSISSAVKKAIQDFIAAIRAFLVRSGLDFGYIQSLTPADLAAMSNVGARVHFDGVFTNNEQGEKMNTAKASADIRYSVGSTVGANPKLKDSILYNLQDRFIDLKNQIEKVVKNGGTISEDSNPYMAEELYHQRTASRIKEFYDKELNPLLKKLHDSGIGLDRFQEFLHARHAPSRNAVMAERNPNQAIIDAKLKDADESLEAVRNNPASTRKELSEALAEYNKWRRAKPFDGTEEERLSLSGMSNQEARDFLNGLTKEEKAVLDPLGDMIDAINEKTLDTQIEYGMETQDSVDALKNQWKHYVPLHRDEAHEDNAFGHPIGRGFSVRGSGMKNATGSNAEVTNILAHIAAAREQMIRRGEKNKVTVALAKFIEQNPDKDFAEINKVDFDKKLNEEGLVESQMEPIFKRNQKDNVVMFRVNGKDQAIVFNEKKPETVRLAMSLKNLDGASLDAVESLIAKGTRWMASVNTQYNIIFGIVNLLRDVQGMMLNLSSTELHGKQRKVFNRLGAAMTTIYNEERGKPSRLSGLYERFNKSGGTTGYTQFFDDIRARNKSIEKEFNKLGQNQAFKIGDVALQWLRDYNTLMENATRFAVFMEAVDSGMSDAKAASLAKNITVNFNRKGAQATKVGAFYAFFNASAQGTARLVETMKGPQGKKIAGGGVLLGAITTLLGMMAMGEDEWEKIPEFVRERSIVIPTGGSNYASIPMPLGFHILPNIGRKLVESAFGSKKVTRSERLLQLVGATANAFNPLGGNDLVDTLSPTVLDPALALMRNQDWTGRQIYRDDFSGLNPTPGFTRKKDSASKASTLAAEFINKATGGTDYKQGYFSPTPDQIDYIFGQFFGGTGREALKLDTAVSSLASGEELPLHKIPLVGRLYGETKGNAVERSAYYENIKRMNEHHAEIKGLSKESNGTMKVRQYLKENPEASLYVKAKAVQRRIDRLNDQRKILVKAGSKTSTIDNQIAAQMKVLNDAINVKING